MPEWLSSFDNDLYSSSYEAGREGKEMPEFLEGWRYGDIPSEGKSYNYRDQRKEYGTSMMEVNHKGEKKETQDQLGTMFGMRERPKRRLMGWLNTVRKGADEEPLLLEPQYHPEDEVLIKELLKKKKRQKEIEEASNMIKGLS